MKNNKSKSNYKQNYQEPSKSNQFYNLSVIINNYRIKNIRHLRAFINSDKNTSNIDDKKLIDLLANYSHALSLLFKANQGSSNKGGEIDEQ